MDEQRQEAYLEIIGALLDCPSGEEPQVIMAANPDFIDIGLVEIMKQVAAVCVQRGEKNTADFLTKIASQIAGALESLAEESIEKGGETSPIIHSVEYHDFLTETLRLVIESDSEPQTVYPFLNNNLDKLDQRCSRELQEWSKTNLSRHESQEAKKIAAGIANLSNILQNFPLGNKASNLEIALTGCEIVATFFDSQVFPIQWAGIQINLGNIYHCRIQGNRADNLEQAIAYYQAALQVFTLEAFPQQWALTQNNLGNVYLERIQGERTRNLEEAIHCYNLALQIRTRHTVPSDWAQTKANLSNAYRERIYGDRASNIEQAIAFCQEALQILTQNDFPQEWAITKTNLGTAYQERIRGNRAENLEVAIAVYREALQIRTRETISQGWAEVQMNLGSAYRTRIFGNRGENLERAIAAFQEALKVFTREIYPQQWALTQTNLGSAYQERVGGDKAENLEMAIAAYESALLVLTREDFPQDWAKIQINLGSAHYRRILGDRGQNLELAISFYQKALQVYTKETLPESWGQTQNNLGNAYGDRINGDREENLEIAIVAYESALQVFTPEVFPQDWAFIQTNLGGTYYNRIRGVREENLEVAIAACQSALQVLTYETFPEDWARAQSNLAAAYYDRIRGSREENLEAAIAACKSALRFYTLDVFPQDYTRTLFTLGLLYQQFGRLHDAYTTFNSAIESVEFQSGKITSGEPVKQKLASQWARYYWSMVEVCLELAIADPQYYARAIEYVERSKARSLVELLAGFDLYPKGDIPESIINELKRLRRGISAKQRQLDMVVELEQLDETNRTYRQQLHQELHSLQQQFNQLLNQIEEIDSNFRVTHKIEPISVEEIRQLLTDDQTALIEWYITGEAIFTFTVTLQAEYPRVWQSSHTEKTALLDWIKEYISDYAQNKNQWQRLLSERLQHLAQILHIDDILSSLPKSCQQLVIIPHLFLHLFPLHALPIADSSRLLDRFSKGVRYAPSCQVLQVSQKQKRSNFTHLFAIQNPTEDLSYSDIEVETIRGIFHPYDDVLVKRAAKKEAINNQQFSTANCVHFSCHAYFNSDISMLSGLLLNDSRVPASSTHNPPYCLSLPDGSAIDLSKCLTLGEIFELDLSQCRLVTLSACETGFIDFQILSDEYVGLPSAFLVAGSPSVVSSLWTVNDLSTAFLMIQLYQNLRTGDSVGVALNQAQLWLRDVTKVELERWIEENQLPLSPAVKMNLRRRLYKLEDDTKPFQSPFYWAAFCAIGQ
ncbi:CHAT domain-containing protein [Calothrix sp. FACHB-156]|uniref:CHAT domain-containing protein n=1 Tax=Nostocaceae TaxID=1162 RepID=UPI001683444B|nr:MULTISPECIES: CHAT domain-containing tetratricopeptide repeat protein [Nostocaceae]MBD2337430.1 CHAT domain-containing protein [Calothrix sp. FACHB-156]MBD2457076.1 CHAT domain-containing protein [Nostoc sp. FACHB-87]MBD2478262.1 CHAT domain-containing protein [Anabaena sp. FACHB-83]